MSNFKQSISIHNAKCHEIPVIISIPHSGLYIPNDIRANLKKDIVLPNSDWYLPELYNFLEEMNFTVLINNVNRYVIDVNRELLRKGYSYKTNVVYTHTTQDYEMYDNELSLHDINTRIEKYYQPYHNALEDLITEKLRYFNTVYIIDLHSFGLDYRADIILGNDYGKACSKDLTSFFKKYSTLHEFTILENRPYSGGYITKNYGTGKKNCEAIQIELWYTAYIKKRVYGNEELPKIDIDLFSDTQKKMKIIFNELKLFLQRKETDI